MNADWRRSSQDGELVATAMLNTWLNRQTDMQADIQAGRETDRQERGRRR